MDDRKSCAQLCAIAHVKRDGRDSLSLFASVAACHPQGATLPYNSIYIYTICHIYELYSEPLEGLDQLNAKTVHSLI